MRIRIADYQALSDVDLEVHGLTVITGPSNIGKSALVRAITGAVFGRSGDYYIRSGQNQTVVHVTDTDLDIEWKKTNKPTTTRLTSLAVDGVLHSKLGREHWKLTEGTGMYGIETTYKQFRPQFAGQHDGPFLLNENDTVVAELMKKVARADVTTKATSLAKADRTDANAKIKTRREDLIQAQALLDELDGLPDLITLHDQLTKDHQCLQLTEQRTSKRCGELARLAALQPCTVPTTPPPVEIPSQARALGLLERFQSLAPASIPPEPDVINPPTSRLDRLRSLNQLMTSTSQSLELQEKQRLAEGELEELDLRKAELEKELGACPTCERSFNEHA